MAFVDTELLRASDGTGPAVLAHVQSPRLIGSTVLDLDNVSKWNSKVIVTTGKLLPSGFMDPATITEMYGRIVAGDLQIDGYEPGYVDAGNTTDQVAIIKQTSGWANRVTDELQALKAEDVTRQSTIVADYVATGGVWTTLAGLNAAMTALTAYISANRNTVAAIATRAFTASKDTYVDILRNTTTGVFTIVYTEVANGAASPALAANSIRLAKVVTSGAAVTSIVQYDRDSLYNLYRPTANSVNQPLYLGANSGNITFTAPFDGTIEADHSSATWGFAGAAYGLAINCNNNAVKLNELRSYVTGGDTVGREVVERATFTNIIKGQSYTVNLAAWVGSGGGVVANSERMTVKLVPR